MIKITFEANYDPLPAEFAQLGFWNGGYNINGLEMERPNGPFIFETEISTGTDYEFNIHTNNIELCGPDTADWVASKSGIRAKILKINEKNLDNSFLFMNIYGNGCNFVFKVLSNGDIVPGQGVPPVVNENIPPEVAFSAETIHPGSTSYSNFYANIWFSAIHDSRKPGTSKVEIDNLKFYARLTNGQDVLLAHDNYETTWGGKLYVRYPYFDCSLDPQFMWDMPAELQNGNLVFFPSENTMRVWHGWCTGPWRQIPWNYQKLWGEADVRISGPALIQLGIDVKPNANSNDGYNEYGAGNWYFESQDFQKIYFNKP